MQMAEGPEVWQGTELFLRGQEAPPPGLFEWGGGGGRGFTWRQGHSPHQGLEGRGGRLPPLRLSQNLLESQPLC